jgi:leucyl aminopeptidase
LISEPSNVLTPENFSGRIIQGFKSLPSVKVRVLGKKEIVVERMNALYGVAKGSNEDPYVVCIEYFGAKNERPVLLVGKGVTFDAGGISMKTEADLEEFPMKVDMAGAASVYASILAAATMGLELNVVGILGLVENMPSGSAQKPSDIVQSRNGKTIEIMTTDCEGRLVLADLIDYGVERYNPSEIIDLATLEIGTMHALHDVYAGLFSNSETLSRNLVKAGEESCEMLWPLPLHDFYNDLIISDIADLKNRNGQTVFASGSTGAHFIGNFVPKDIPWAHIDIAGVTLRSRAVNAIGPGVSGFGGRLLTQYLYQSAGRQSESE